jgi:hypothetical protein
VTNFYCFFGVVEMNCYCLWAPFIQNQVGGCPYQKGPFYVTVEGLMPARVPLEAAKDRSQVTIVAFGGEEAYI